MKKRGQQILVKKIQKAYFPMYVNNRKNIRCKISQLKDNQGVLQTDDEVRANIFNEYFASVFTKDNYSTPEPKIRFESANDSVLNTIVCNYEYVEK